MPIYNKKSHLHARAWCNIHLDESMKYRVNHLWNRSINNAKNSDNLNKYIAKQLTDLGHNRIAFTRLFAICTKICMTI